MESDAEVCISHGDDLHASADLIGALECYSQAATLAPGDTEAWYSHGNVLRELGRPLDASASYMRALDAEPDDIDLWHIHGVASFAASSYDGAARSYSRAIELLIRDGAEAGAIADMHVCRGNALEMTTPHGRERAIEDFRRALELVPSHADATNNLSNAHARLVWAAAPAAPAALATPLTPYRTLSLPALGGFEQNQLHHVHLCHWLDAVACARLVATAEEHGRWGTARHEDFSTTDIECSTVPELAAWVAERLRTTLLPTLAALFDVPASRLEARECFVVQYSTAGQRALPLHRDGYTFSFNVLLSGGFGGGGTLFDALGVVRPDRMGDCLFHCGQMLHGAAPVTGSKSRYILVGFVEVVEPDVREAICCGACSHADSHSGATAGLGGLQEPEKNPGTPRERDSDHETLARYWHVIRSAT